MAAIWLRLLRAFSMLDGASFIYLLFHAIYSKRIMGNEDAIHTPGMIHGIIFCALGVTLLVASFELKWPFRRTALVFACAIIPIAPFFLEVSLSREQKRLQAEEA